MTEPETKRRRLGSDVESEDVIMDPKVESLDEKAEIEKLITKMKLSKANLKPVLADELIGSVPGVNVYIGKALDRKLIHKVIVTLNNLLPLPDLQHLKRARNVEILICPSDDMSPEEVSASLKDKGFDLSAHLEEGFKIISVASKPPLLKRQYEEANKVWPCNFHPNAYTERLVSGEFFDKSEVSRHRKYMELAYDVAEIYEGVREKSEDVSINGNTDDPLEIGLVKAPIEEITKLTGVESVRTRLTELRGVVVVDPDIDSIVAVGYDRRNIHPCQHAIMIAIDNVARSQQGGAWNDNSMFAEELSNLDKRELVLEGVPKMFRNILNTSYDGLKFGARRTARRCEAQDASRDTECVKLDQDVAKVVEGSLKRKCFESSMSIDSSTSVDLQSVKLDQEEEIAKVNEDGLKKKCFETSMSIESSTSSVEPPPDKPSGPYLCTGYDFYTTNEPCIMCSMALVHSRARRVMFALRNTESGALTSISKLHTVAALNHHYEVFTGFFEEPLS